MAAKDKIANFHRHPNAITIGVQSTFLLVSQSGQKYDRKTNRGLIDFRPRLNGRTVLIFYVVKNDLLWKHPDKTPEWLFPDSNVDHDSGADPGGA
jgi:hypothetical protein